MRRKVLRKGRSEQPASLEPQIRIDDGDRQLVSIRTHDDGPRTLENPHETVRLQARPFTGSPLINGLGSASRF